MSSPRLERLSAREEQVLGLAADGLLDKQIALSLGISENTLRTYWKRIRVKMGDASRSALAAQFARGKMGEMEDGGVWSLDVERGTVDYSGDRGILPQGESAFEESLTAFHPDDRTRLRAIVRTMVRNDPPPITLVARVTTDRGYEKVCFRIEPVRGLRGRVDRLVGHPVPILDMTHDGERTAHFGHYRRDLDTGAVEVDEGFREIYRIPRDEPDLRAAVLQRYCPSSREKMRDLVDGMIAGGQWRRRQVACLCFEGGERVWVTSQSHLEEKEGRPSAFAATIVAYF